MQLDLPPQKVRVALLLVTLALCAFFLADTTTTVVASKWLPLGLPAKSDQRLSATATGTKAPGDALPDMTAILSRNIFDPTTGSLWPPKPAADDAALLPADQPATLAPGQMPPPCDGTARLVAAVYSPKLPDWSFASLSLGNASPLLYRVGAAVEGKQLDSIYPSAVFLKAGNGGLCSLTMFKSPNQPAAPPGLAAPAPGAAPTVGPTPAAALGIGGSLSEAELDQNIRQVSDNRYTVTRALIDKVLQNQAELMRSARVVPHEENGRVVGVKLYGIRRSSLLGKLGLQNGDLMRTINGFDMSSPDSALEAYSKLRSAGNFSVAVVRRGNAVNMDYQVSN